MLGNFYKAENAAENDFVYSDEMKKILLTISNFGVLYI